MHLAWPVPGSGIDDPEGLYRHIFEAHAYLLGKDHHLMVVPRFESDPIQLAEPAFRHISLKPATLTVLNIFSIVINRLLAKVLSVLKLMIF